MRDKYQKHMLKVCSKAGKHNEYNAIRAKYMIDFENTTDILKKIHSDFNEKSIEIGKKYTDLLHKEMKGHGERIKELRKQIEDRRREMADLDREMNERHKYYQRLTVEDVKKLKMDFEAMYDRAFAEIDERMNKELRETLGYLE